MIRADRIKVDDDEGRYVLMIRTDDGDKLTVDIHDDVLAFYASVQAEIRPYVLEAEAARVSRPIVSMHDGFGYELDDPKHPTYHERMVD